MVDDPLKKISEKREAERLLVPRKAYETTEGVGERHSLDRQKMSSAVGLDQETTRNAINRLCSDGLLKHMGTRLFMLTHAGCEEIERSMKNPATGTAYFSSGAIHLVMNNFHAPVASVQTGNQNTAPVDQAVAATKPDEE